MKEVELNLPFESKSHGTYSEEEFEQMLLNDVKFRDKWSTIK